MALALFYNWNFQCASSSGPLFIYLFIFKKREKRHSSFLPVITINTGSRIHPMQPIKRWGHFQRGEGLKQCSVQVLCFVRGGYFICCRSLGRPRGRPVQLMFPNMLTALSVGTSYCGRKKGGTDVSHSFKNNKIMSSLCALCFPLMRAEELFKRSFNTNYHPFFRFLTAKI